MGASAVDIPAILLVIGLARVITVTLVRAHRDDQPRRGWIAAGILFLGLLALGIVDLLRYSPRETLFSVVAVGVAVPVLGAFGMVRATHRSRPWLRWTLTYLTALFLLFGGLLLGAAVSRWLPF